ncbi:MAG: hypothetical protein NTU79_17500, partial [Planctomycetota bacterium]|nr:hypothetical protein [Planctomycetota bacterium]
MMVRFSPLSLLGSKLSRLAAFASNELKRNAFRRALIRSNGLKRRTSHRSILETLESRNLMAGLPIAVN